MDEPKGTHRTRSRAAPDWTVEESLVLVNEIYAVESEWGPNLPSFQKWQQIVENCNALDVSRNLNQCKRKWDALLSEYTRARHQPADGSFPAELFNAIEICLNDKGKRSGGSEVYAAEVAAVVSAEEKDEQLVVGTDPDSDPDAQPRLNNFIFKMGSKKQRRRTKRKKRRLQTRSPWGYTTNPKHEESSSINEKVTNPENIDESLPDESDVETQEQIMANVLYENAEQINEILEGNLADDVAYKVMDLKNDEAVQIDFTRRQGDKLIDCLGIISVTLNQLCDLVQQSK